MLGLDKHGYLLERQKLLLDPSQPRLCPHCGNLEEADVPVEHFHYPDVPRAALTSVRLAKGFERSYDALDDVCTAFRDGLTR